MDKRLSFAAALLGAGALAALLTHPSQPPAPRVQDLPRPQASREASALVVYVAGAVRVPGVYSVPAGSRAAAAVKAAGGATSAAELADVNLAERLEDGQEVLVPDHETQTEPKRSRQAHGHQRRRRHGRSKHPRRSPERETAPSPIDLNRADAGALSRVPGIGDALADRIVAFRDLNGPFGDLSDLLDVGGMSQARLDRASAFLRLR